MLVLIVLLLLTIGFAIVPGGSWSPSRADDHLGVTCDAGTVAVPPDDSKSNA